MAATAAGQWLARRLETAGNASGWGIVAADGLLTSWFFQGFTGAGAAQNIAFSRVFSTADVGKVHLIVGSLSVTGSRLAIYTNGLDDGTPDASVAAFAAADATAVGSLLGDPTLADEAGLTGWDVMDIGFLSGYAMTAADAAAMFKTVKATGRVPEQPPSGSWYHLFRAERLVGHSGVWDAGGLSEGRGFLCELSGAPALPTLSSIQIGPNDWGGGGF